MKRLPYICRRCDRRKFNGQCKNIYCPDFEIGKRHRFKAGSKVTVKGYPASVRTVVQVYSDIQGGRRLDENVDGFVSWNVSDLRSARTPRKHGG